MSKPGEIDVQIRWRSGVLTNFFVHRTAPGDRSLKTPEEAVAKIHEMAGQYTYNDIADHLNAAGYRTAFGRLFTQLHVGYICRRDGSGSGAGATPKAKTSPPRQRSLIC